MNLTTANAKQLELLSRLYGALSNLTSYGVAGDPALEPSCRAALRICVDRLYSALNCGPFDPLDPDADRRFRLLAGEAALHAEAILSASAGV